MAHALDRCEHDSIKWFPRATLEKYSPDQSEFAERKLHGELSWGRRMLISRRGIWVPRMHGDWLREMFAEPEDGYAYTEGNSLVNGGLAALTSLLLGSGGQSFIPGGTSHAIIGAGTGTSATTAGMTALQSDNTANAWYQASDATYPHVDGTTVGQLDGQVTVTSTNGNFASGWTEWCWATGTSATGSVTGTTLASLSGTTVMFNRWTGTSLGVKGAGATWVFSCTISFSLSQLGAVIRTLYLSFEIA
jgi:hypothetical protein